MVDADGDGAPAANRVDCNDTRRRPSARARSDVPGDGIDQDCTGADAKADRDGDTFTVDQDCDDGNAVIHPGAREVPGNLIDENCDGLVARFTRVSATATLAVLFGKSFTRLKSLKVTDLEAGDVVKVTCTGRGCKRKIGGTFAIAKKTAVLNLTKRVKGIRLRTRARVEARISHDGQIARVFRFTVKRYKDVPVRTMLCQPPGAAKPGAC